MAPLPVENTARLFVDYEVANVGHTMQLRLAGGASPIAALDNLAYILGFCSAFLPTSWMVTGVRLAQAGSTVTNPVNYQSSELYGFVGTGGTALAAVDHPRQLVWVGRSLTSGRRVRLSLYGALVTTPANYRFGPGETVFASAEVIAALNVMGANSQAVCIDGTATRWYSYVNVNYNSYWESERRSSS